MNLFAFNSFIFGWPGTDTRNMIWNEENSPTHSHKIDILNLFSEKKHHTAQDEQNNKKKMLNEEKRSNAFIRNAIQMRIIWSGWRKRTRDSTNKKKIIKNIKRNGFFVVCAVHNSLSVEFFFFVHPLHVYHRRWITWINFVVECAWFVVCYIHLFDPFHSHTISPSYISSWGQVNFISQLKRWREKKKIKIKF